MLTGIYRRARDYFAKKEIPAGMDQPLAYGSDLILANVDFPEYNPDMLIGVKGWKIYQTMMIDEQVLAVSHFRRDAVTGRAWCFEIPEEEIKLIGKSEAAARVKLFYNLVSMLPGSWKTKMDLVMASLYQGFSMTEIVFKMVKVDKKSWVGIDSLRKKPYQTFFFVTDPFGGLRWIEQRVGGRTKKFDADKFIHHVHNPDVHEYYGQSELRSAYRAYWSKDVTIKFANIYVERLAGGFVWADMTDAKMNANSKEYQQLQAVISNINGLAGVIAPPGVKLNLEHPSGTDAFEKAVAMHDKSIAKSLLMPNLLGLSEQGGVGSYGQSQTQLEGFLWTSDAEAGALCETLNEQLFRQLGDENFGDGVYPRFKLKALSDSQKAKIIGQWKDLVTAKAVTPTIEDQQHVRQMLDFPALDKDAAMPTPSSSALTGVQISSMIDIIDKVRTEKLDPETAVMILVESFPIDEKRAKEIIESIEITGPDALPVPGAIDPKTGLPIPPAPGEEGEIDPATGKPKQPAASPGKGAPPAKQPKEGEVVPKLEDGEEEEYEHTIAGSARVSISAFNKAQKRVAFAVIDRQEMEVVNDFVPRISKVFASWLSDVEAWLTESKVGTPENNDVEPIKKFVMDNQTKQKLQNVLKIALKEGWRLGTKHAAAELDQAKAEHFSKKISFERLEDNAAKFFDAKIFTITGSFSDEAVATIRNILFNGIKASKTTPQLIEEIYTTFARKGMLSREHIVDALGEALDYSNPDARLRTIINTNVFESMNEARYSFFTDPTLSGFVEAFAYSSILDARTTEICEHMDDKTYARDSAVWDTHRPPNHYNCRSLLIPVTQADTWEEDEPPTISPQEGFG